MGLVWKDPPRGQSRRADTDLLVEELRANPGVWALVEVDAWSACKAKYERRGCEARTVKVSDGPTKHDIYARWPVAS